MSRQSEKTLKQARLGDRHYQHYNLQQAVQANIGINKEEWLKEVKAGHWAVAHYNCTINFAYRDDITKLSQYVRQIPDNELAEFITTYGAYLKELVIKQNGSKYLRTLKYLQVHLSDPKNFLPEVYDKAFNDNMQTLIEIYADGSIETVIM